jgi:hypothetical protein
VYRSKPPTSRGGLARTWVANQTHDARRGRNQARHSGHRTERQASSPAMRKRRPHSGQVQGMDRGEVPGCGVDGHDSALFFDGPGAVSGQRRPSAQARRVKKAAGLARETGRTRGERSAREKCVRASR